MSLTIRFVGGPADGQTWAIPDASPPPLYFIPLAPSIAELMSTSLELTPIREAEYEPQFEGGLFRVADDGAYLYRHRVAPLTAHERADLARKREESRAAEECRAAERDAAWRQIRQERPGYPEDWRDLF
ncbi:hypothetical protein ACIBAC_11885 [Streptomyces sp. NPDC051362]|uniref:hypothetical protein n=1 Tax=Streptomyces sp. NPDC051362 TaxID=3365651 RepID=UPI0037A2F9D5